MMRRKTKIEKERPIVKKFERRKSLRAVRLRDLRVCREGDGLVVGRSECAHPAPPRRDEKAMLKGGDRRRRTQIC